MAAGDPNEPVNTTPAAPVVPKPPTVPPSAPQSTFVPPPPATPPAPPEAPLELAPSAPKQAYFCLEAGHPGQSTPRADQFELGRMFYVPANIKGAPTCPSCRKQVSAIPVDDTSKLPPSLQATADRLTAAERQR